MKDAATALPRLADRSDLSDAALLVEIDGPPSAAVRRFVEQAGGLVLAALREPMTVERDDRRHRVDKPDGADRLRLWQQVLGGAGAGADPSLVDAGAAFHLSLPLTSA